MSKYDKLVERGEFGKKKKINSKRKGSLFERHIAKNLNERFNTKEFVRTPGSGAFGTTHKNLPQYFKVHGDLITPENFKFVIECKNGYDVRIEDIFKPKSILYDFIAQASRDGELSGKPWLLIYKRDRQEALVITNTEFDLNNKIKFKNYKIYTLKDILSLPDNLFFV